MLAVLPKRSADELSGELFVAAYQKKLGHLPNDAISFIADRAMERCQWFPTIAECLEIYQDWRRKDEHTERRWLASQIVSEERHARIEDERNFEKAERRGLTQADVDMMGEEMKRIGLACHALMRNDDGTISPWKPKPGEEVF